MKKIDITVRTVFGIMLLGILLILFFSASGTTYICQKFFLISNKVIAAAALGLLGAFALLSARRSPGKALDGRGMDRVILACAVALFLAQMYVIVNIFFETGWDPLVLSRLARRNSGYHRYSKNSLVKYLSRYPNNMAIGILYSAILTVNHDIGVLPEPYEMMSIVTINALANSMSCYLTYRIVRKLSGPGWGLAGFCLCTALVGFSPWTTICYSDSFVMIFPTLIVFLYFKKAGTRAAAAVKWGLIVALSCLGFLFKPYVLIITIALFLITVVRLLLENRRRWYAIVALALCAPLCFAGLYRLADVCLEGVYAQKYDMKLNREKSFGWQHYLMMGMNEERQGIYAPDDVKMSDAFETGAERNRANLQTAAQRVREMGFGRLAEHLKKKLLNAYNDGTFAWGMEGRNFYRTQLPLPNRSVAPFLRDVFYGTGQYHGYLSTALQALWLLTLMLCFAATFSKPHRRYGHVVTAIMLAIIGLTLYELLFEMRARHLYAYAPLYTVLATIGLKAVRDGAVECRRALKRRALQSASDT